MASTEIKKLNLLIMFVKGRIAELEKMIAKTDNVGAKIIMRRTLEENKKMLKELEKREKTEAIYIL